ncbi:hypothetical protein [Thermococcus waiotapuensis]|uniref:Uncharacterized protein n=1 Tax=Thermococcus waiotapuensis TaxID=90909 RepID=A0AAE4NV64_9EURY|nr:hypothetical protein [Thermococcus waiotapuensis]MDV3104155.1 hypothetical protein [Thermococcus waiotapuensis]
MKITKDEARIKRALLVYIRHRGFPEALRFGREYLMNLYNDIITKDVIVHYGIRNVHELKEVAFYLFFKLHRAIHIQQNQTLSESGTLRL